MQALCLLRISGKQNFIEISFNKISQCEIIVPKTRGTCGARANVVVRVVFSSIPLVAIK